MFDLEFIDDNGTITCICVKNRSEAIDIYCRGKGCPKEWVKDHCIIRHTKLPEPPKGE